MVDVTIRPVRPGELLEARMGEGDFDDFGPRPGHAQPPSCRVDDNGSLAIVSAGQVVGGVGWRWNQWGPNAASRCPMIGIWLQADARGHGLGTQAQRLVVDLLFRHTTTNRVEAHTDVENVAERRSLEKIGMRAEGITRGAQWRDGAYRDGYLYAVLRGEWAPLDGTG